MRAEPYSAKDHTTAKPNFGFSNTFKSAGQNAPEEKSAKMSSAFNGASKAKSPEPEPKKPEVKL